jgi:hypothetical protein
MNHSYFPGRLPGFIPFARDFDSNPAGVFGATIFPEGDAVSHPSVSEGRSPRTCGAATLAVVGTVLFILAVVVLHFIKSDLDPSWHFISEYELGKNGWIMQIAFLALAVGNFSLLAAIRPAMNGTSGWIGILLYAVGAIGVVLGGLFVPDPMNSAPESLSLSGKLHNLGGGLGLAGFVGTVILSVKLIRNSNCRTFRKSVLLATGILVLGFLVSFFSIASLAAKSGGVFGPDTPVGWPNRIGILAGCLWIIIIARQVRLSAKVDPPLS